MITINSNNNQYSQLAIKIAMRHTCKMLHKVQSPPNQSLHCTKQYLILKILFFITATINFYSSSYATANQARFVASRFNNSNLDSNRLLSHLSKNAVELLPSSNQHSLTSNYPFNFSASSALQMLPPNSMQSTSQINAQNKLQRLPERICFGTNNRLSAPNNSDHHYQNLRDRYTNCTYVDGNLEITKLPENADLSFLQSIREVTGYVLIALVNVERVKLHSLLIIRGQELFKTMDGSEYSLMILQNNMRYLEMPALQDILMGSVGLTDNYNLCLINTISWDSIIDNTNLYRVITVFNDPNRGKPACPRCHQSCNDQCWSESQNMCQQMQPFSCHSTCSSKRCFGPDSNQCCHSFCVGGCTGSTERDCFACKNFNDDGECMQECPPINRYNPTLYQLEPNPRGRYAHGSSCVKECPGHLLRDNGACVRKCPPNKRSQGDECINCIGPCPKECQGVEVVHSGNVDQLKNCTVIEGSISILDSSFSGYTEFSSSNYSVGTMHPPMSPSKLEALKTIREITGYLNIQANHPDFTNLSFFRNLEIIGGRSLMDMYALSIMKTSLVSLNLRALKKVRAGRILIEENKDLCFAETMNWNQVNVSDRASIVIKNNRDIAKCREDNLVCHEQCTSDGCTGPNQDECSACKFFKFEDFCVNNCEATKSLGYLSYMSASNTCNRCHEECKDGCHTSSDSKNCFNCKNVKDGPHCVAKCPTHKYSTKFNSTCSVCHDSCVSGCTGMSNRLGYGGCNQCGKAIINSTSSLVVSHCIKADEPCADGYYQEYVNLNSRYGEFSEHQIGKLICRKCHSRCKRCSGMGTHTSVCECAKYVAGDHCEDVCPRDSYADEKSKRCLKCSPECISCRGPTEADCLSCRAYRIYQDDINPSLDEDIKKTNFRFNCTDKCPTSKPYKISGVGMLDPYCSDRPDAFSGFERTSWYNSTIFLIFLVIVLSVIVTCFWIFYKCQIKQKDKTVKLTMHLSGFSDVEPLYPSNVRPNLAPLRTIKETELRRGKLLGSGFGGKVYQGFWYPNGQESEQRPVAIKVITDNGNSNMNKEFLEEAYTMSLANHKHLVRLLGVCMTPDEMILVTPLMALGCLLDYVIKNENDDFKPKNILEWCKQIADGMAFLEESRIVHRDLALRNVLLQTSGKALITDFGLAKFLEVNETEYHSCEGRLPIKWLAPECLKEKIFTHKSDVWAFGVTIWELLTRGRKPYEDCETEQVPALIEAGARLPQPSHVSAEIHKIMLACWFYKPEDRPNFEELKQTFIRYARDPSRYLIIDQNELIYSNSDHDYNNEIVEDGQDHHQQNMSSEVLDFHTDEDAEPITPLTPGRRFFVHDNRSKFDFDTRNLSESDTNQSQQSIITRRITSFRNGSSSTMQSNSNVRNFEKFTVPTDDDNYLEPSPSSKEFDHFNTFSPRSYDRKLISTAPSTPLTVKLPHSAGPYRVENEEYFVERIYHSTSNNIRRSGGVFFPSTDVLYNNEKNDKNPHLH